MAIPLNDVIYVLHMMKDLDIPVTRVEVSPPMFHWMQQHPLMEFTDMPFAFFGIPVVIRNDTQVDTINIVFEHVTHKGD